MSNGPNLNRNLDKNLSVAGVRRSPGRNNAEARRLPIEERSRLVARAAGGVGWRDKTIDKALKNIEKIWRDSGIDKGATEADIEEARAFFEEMAANIRDRGFDIFPQNIRGQDADKYYGPRLSPNRDKIRERIRTGAPSKERPNGDPRAIVDVLAFVAAGLGWAKARLNREMYNRGRKVYEGLPAVFRKLFKYETAPSALGNPRNPWAKGRKVEELVLQVAMEYPEPKYSTYWPLNQTDDWYRRAQEEGTY